MVESLHILVCFKIGLIVWALMFADVIPGAFYVLIIASIVSVGFVVAGARSWLMTVFTVYWQWSSGSL